MFRKRQVSRPNSKLAFRLKAAKTIDPDFDFGNGIHAAELEALLNNLDEAIDSYNQTLSDADELRLTIRDLEQQANDASDRLLRLTGGTYGPDSVEYQRMGGTRKSEIDYSGSHPETFTGEDAADTESAATGNGTT